MRLLNKHFFLGLAAGVALTLWGVNLGTMYLAHKALIEEAGGIRKALGTIVRGQRSARPPLAALSGHFLGYAPEAWSVRSLDGGQITLAGLRGRVVFLNFWATWCGPCVAEMESIEKLSESLRDDPVVFLLVTDENEPTVRNFLHKRPYRIPIYLRRGRLPDIFQAPGIPATFLVDRTGAVVVRHFGNADWNSDVARNFIRNLETR